MKLVFAKGPFLMRTESDRIVIETDIQEEDRDLDRAEVARRLNKSVRTIDLYRHMTGEARLHCHWRNNRIMVKESELNRWQKYILANPTAVGENLDGSNSRFRPRSRRWHRVVKPIRLDPSPAPS
jgi:hypothetical protein